MPAKTFILSRKANKDISKLPIRIQDKIGKSFSVIKANPLSGAKLHGELAGGYKFRIGDYRIIYKFHPKESLVEIVKIEHRQGVYK